MTQATDPSLCFGHRRDEVDEIFKAFVNPVLRSTGTEVCLVEILEPSCESCILFSLASSLEISTVSPYRLHSIRPTNEGSCEAKWLREGTYCPIIEHHISKAKNVPKEWRNLHMCYGVESVVVIPLCYQLQDRSRKPFFLASLTLAHRKPGFFGRHFKVHENIMRQCNGFLRTAPLGLLGSLAKAIHQLQTLSSVEDHAKVLQELFSKATPSLSVSYAAFDDSYQSAVLFIDSSSASSEGCCCRQMHSRQQQQQQTNHHPGHQCRSFKKHSFQLHKQTIVWRTTLNEDIDGIAPIGLEPSPHLFAEDLKLIRMHQSSHAKSVWVVPLKKPSTSSSSSLSSNSYSTTRNDGQKTQPNVVPGTITLHFNSYSGKNRWSGYLGALYLCAEDATVFSDAVKCRVTSIIKCLYNVLDKNKPRRSINESMAKLLPDSASQLNSSIQKNIGFGGVATSSIWSSQILLGVATTTPTSSSSLHINRSTIGVPEDFMKNFKVAQKEERLKKDYQKSLQKLMLTSVLDSSCSSSLVIQGTYDHRDSATKFIPGSQGHRHSFNVSREFSIMFSISHFNIVQSLGYAVEVPGSEILKMCCQDGAGSVEQWLHQKWPFLQDPRHLNWNLLIMEYCDKGSLSTMIHQKRIFDQQEANHESNLLLTLLDISKAMEYLHDKGFVHGDLKPANILIKSCDTDPRKWISCIADFGSSLVKGFDSEGPSFDHGCTFVYRAPEMMTPHYLRPRYKHQDGCYADVYSFGITLYEMMEGCLPFEKKTKEDIFRMVHDQKKHPTLRSTHFSGDIVRLLHDCWAYEAHRRPTFVEISQRLRQIIADEK